MLINILPMPKEIKRIHTPAGNRKKILYKYEFDIKYGCPRRVKSGEMDIQDYIQQSADDVDFKTIGKMLVDTRDNVASHFTMEGEEFDCTRLPRNIHEYEAMHNKMKEEFDQLPDAIKNLFGGKFDSFAGAWRNGSIGTIMDNYYKSLETPTDSVTKETTND